VAGVKSSITTTPPSLSHSSGSTGQSSPFPCPPPSRARSEPCEGRQEFSNPIARAASTNGAYRADWEAGLGQPPFTTVAWRIWHLVGVYGERRNREWLGLPPGQAADRFERTAPAPPSAIAAVEALGAAHAEWAIVLSMLTDATLQEKLGAVAGPFADSDKAGFVLHMIDEAIHHGAEVALLRDLWRGQMAPADE
jgi:DinB superfamily